MKDLKQVYLVPTEGIALENLDTLEENWGKKYLSSIASWRKHNCRHTLNIQQRFRKSSTLQILSKILIYSYARLLRVEQYSQLMILCLSCFT